MKQLRRFFLFAILCLFLGIAEGMLPRPLWASSPEMKFRALFSEICMQVEQEFFLPNRVKALMVEKLDQFREAAAKASDLDAFGEVVNLFLAELKTSHTAFFAKDSPEYFQYLSVFGKLPQIRKLLGGRDPAYSTIGIYTRKFEGKTFILWVLDGSPAAKAGLKQGDEIVGVGDLPFHPVRSLQGKVGQPISLKIRRYATGKPFSTMVTPALVNPHQEFLDAELASVRIYSLRGRKIGYIHLWSYAGEDYHEAFLDEIAGGKLKDADSLILDLRDGLGGANPAYLNVFNQNVPVITFTDRQGVSNTFDPQWRKPVVLLINGRSKSGKEVFAFGFQKFGLGTIIGECSGGAVTAGKIIPLSDGSLLYVAAAGGPVDGVILEGVGVSPDIEVPMPIPYLAGKDTQLAKAVEFLSGRGATEVGTGSTSSKIENQNLREKE